MAKFQLSTPHVSEARFSDRVNGTESGDVDHRRNNYALCQCINLTSLGIVLEKMVNEDKLNPQLAVIFKIQTSALLASILSENNRIHNL